jgi:DNA-binding NtrC family response regulator
MKPSILIVEDEKIVREGLVRALSHAYKTYQARNGQEAIDILAASRDIKVVVSDLKIPESDGLVMLKKIRAEHENVQVIFLTAFSSIESAVEAIRKGAFDYIPKPIDLKKLETTINNAIQSTISKRMAEP